jgi:serine/threonine-protein kinase
MTTQEPQELPVIPELADDYELIRELGRGGTAVVYLARERDLGRLVAIKLIHPSYVQDEEAMARMVREAKTISRLQHPNIVMLYGARRLGDRGYALVLQYVPGVTVKARLRNEGPFPLPLVERVLNDLGTALQYAHQHRIVHRDIKPENIFLDEDTGAARLADFGIARFWDSDSGLTLPGTALGTPNYMSPEQIDGSRDLDGRSDIYSVGLVAWEMLTGRQPWAGETLYNIVYKQKHEELPPLAELRPEIPYYFRAAVEGALWKNPARRWRDAGELLAALQNPYAHLAHPRRPPLPATSEPPSLDTSSGSPAAGMEDAETVVLARGELERSWARSNAREPAPRGARTAPPKAMASGPPSSPGSGQGASTPPAEPLKPPAGRAKSPPEPPKPAGGPPKPVESKPRAQPSKPPPNWLVALERGTPDSGPWMIDDPRDERRWGRRIVAGAVVFVLAATAIVLTLL